ncbi:MAG: AAC(3) family N-acetyltransferase, partial [Pseudomonadota bacterium]
MLGLEAGDLVMLHCSFRSLRPVDDGPDAVIDAVLDAVSPGGGLVVFASWAQTPYDACLRGLTDEERKGWPVFDPATAPVKPSYGGAVGTVLAQRDGVVRSPGLWATPPERREVGGPVPRGTPGPR